MANIDLVALKAKPGNALGSFVRGKADALGLQRAEIQNKSAELGNALEKIGMIGRVSIAAMNGNLDGQVDPAKWDSGLDILERAGLDVAEYRDSPSTAPLAARASMDVLQNLDQVRSEQELIGKLTDYERRLRESLTPKPQSGIAKLNSDLRSGLISQEQYDLAAAKLNASKAGMTFTTPDGSTVHIGGNNGLGKKAANDLQTGIIGNTELLDLTKQVWDSYDPEFLTYQGQGEGFFTKQAEKLGMNPGEARKDFLKRRTKFVTGVERLFNAYRKEITGAAAAVQELDRLKQSFINADMSPSQFEAAFEGYQDELRRSIRLRNRLLREGLDPRTAQGGSMFDNLFLTGADDDIEARGNELAEKGMSEAEILETLEREGYGT